MIKRLMILLTSAILYGSSHASYYEVAKMENLNKVQKLLGECIHDNGVDVFDAVALAKKPFYIVKSTYIERDFQLYSFCYNKMKSSDIYIEAEKLNIERKKLAAIKTKNKREKLRKKRLEELQDFITNKGYRPTRKELLEEAIYYFSHKANDGTYWFFRDGVKIKRNSKGETIICHAPENRNNQKNWCLLDYELYSNKYNMPNIMPEEVAYIRKKFPKESKSFTIQKGPKYMKAKY